MASVPSIKKNYFFIFFWLCFTLNFFIFLYSAPALSAAVYKNTEKETTSLDKTSKRKIVDWTCQKLNEIYVLPEKAKEMADFILKQFKSGMYDKARDLNTFTQMLTRDLKSVYPDKHLRLYYDPRIVDKKNNPISETERAARQKERWQMNNYGFKKLEHLPGNIGYLKMDGFANSLWARDKAVGVMHFFSTCNALIIDLSDNRGGYGSMIKLILSYFFKDATHLGSRYIRKNNFTQQAWTTVHVDGSKMTDVDVYVLTSKRTFSAAEAFAFHLKRLNRGTIVGEKTAGGGHTVESVPNYEFKITARIPDSRAFDPASGMGFEGVGVAPDVEVPQEKAFDKAYIMALEKISGKASGRRKQSLEWLAEYHKTKYSPMMIKSSILKNLAGSYRSIKIIFEKGHLYVIWPKETVHHLLMALSKDTFLVNGDPGIRLHFNTDKSGDIEAVTLIYSDGYRDKIPRSNKKEKRGQATMITSLPVTIQKKATSTRWMRGLFKN